MKVSERDSGEQFNKNGVPFLGDSRGKTPRAKADDEHQQALDKKAEKILLDQIAFTRAHHYLYKRR